MKKLEDFSEEEKNHLGEIVRNTLKEAWEYLDSYLNESIEFIRIREKKRFDLRRVMLTIPVNAEYIEGDEDLKESYRNLIDKYILSLEVVL